MTPDQIIRWTWTVLTACGTLFAAWNLREVLIDSWAVSQVRRSSIDVLRILTTGAVYDHGLILLALLLDFVAGIGALVSIPLVPLIALIVQALALILLSFGQTRRRRQIVTALRLRPAKKDSNLKAGGMD